MLPPLLLPLVVLLESFADGVVPVDAAGLAALLEAGSVVAVSDALLVVVVAFDVELVAI